MPDKVDSGGGGNSLNEIDYRKLSTMQQALIDSANYGIISTEIDGTIPSFNNAASNMLGYSAAELVGKHNPELFHDPEQIIH